MTRREVCTPDPDTAAVRDEYGEYTRSFFAHPGGGLDWNPDVPLDDRPARARELFADQPSPSAP